MKDDHMRIPRERKVIMGYFDDAKASREEENTLEHSSGAWKKHKYIQKIGEGASAKYKYAKDKITGESYKRDAENYRNKSNSDSEYAKGIKREAEADAERFGISKDRALDDVLESTSNGGLAPMRQRYNAVAERAAYNGRKAAEAESAYYTKSLAGKSKATVDKGKALIKDFFTPKTKVTVSSNLTGKETINTKPAEKVTLKKNKLSFKK